jgi:hypothetical protein
MGANDRDLAAVADFGDKTSEWAISIANGMRGQLESAHAAHPW